MNADVAKVYGFSEKQYRPNLLLILKKLFISWIFRDMGNSLNAMVFVALLRNIFCTEVVQQKNLQSNWGLANDFWIYPQKIFEERFFIAGSLESAYSLN